MKGQKDMVRQTQVIQVYSQFNPFIDFMIQLDPAEDTNRVIEIIDQACSRWFEPEKYPYLESTPLPEYICDNLTENNIKYDVYFKLPEEEDI